ncbi:hypothetical protein Leryth_014370 [Lithospermum erythrorhizon]|nr:hypothetical protein Leryth_014370 [Lithospermum erythrorhizon]
MLNQLKSEIDVPRDGCSSKQFRLAEQIVFNCLKMLESVISYDPESTSWMRLKPKKDRDDPSPYKWEDVVQMFNDLINCLDEEKDFLLHVEKVEVMKEGLYQIRDLFIDKNIGYKENRYQESLVQKKLIKTLGHSSRCLYTLLLYYLFGTVNDPEVEVCGAVYPRGHGDRFLSVYGKILTSTDWGNEGDLEVQGHLWCVGANNRLLSYRGNSYFLHGLNL